MITRREFGLISAAAALPLPRAVALADGEAVHRSHGSALVRGLRYPAGFPHFQYVNPEAPKGGRVRLVRRGGFDGFNPYVDKGEPASRGLMSLQQDRLMQDSLDEGSSSYCLLAEWVEHPASTAWAAFKIREDAAWHDGRPVEPADLVFTLDVLKQFGYAELKRYYLDVESAADEGGGVVRFRFATEGNKELPHIVGQLPALPRHWWEGRDFGQALSEPPLGSGPYRVGRFEFNRFVEFERVDGYWGKAHPARVGTGNFDRIRYEYFQDGVAAFEAFKVGDIDFRPENSSRVWATGYDFAAVESKAVILEAHDLEGPETVQAFLFNLRRDKFADVRVREALSLVFDFEWTNRTLYYGQYKRPYSFFLGTADLTPEGIPEGRELELLESVREHVPPEVFGAPFRPASTDGTGQIRRQLRRAGRLLDEAGWRVRDGERIDREGRPFTLEFLSAQAEQERIIGPYLRNVGRLGIKAELRVVDSAQYGNRLKDHDFDMVIWGWLNSESPGNEQRAYWGSEAADLASSGNLAGLRNAGVDQLVDRIVLAGDREELAAASRALDRVLTFIRPAVMQLYAPLERIAYWDRFGRPDPLPSRAIGFPDVWWWDEAKAQATAERIKS